MEEIEEQEEGGDEDEAEEEQKQDQEENDEGAEEIAAAEEDGAEDGAEDDVKGKGKASSTGDRIARMKELRSRMVCPLHPSLPPFHHNYLPTDDTIGSFLAANDGV